MIENESLNAYQRRLKIIQQIQEKGEIRIADLTQKYGVSDTAIRRDLNILERDGQMRRIHGGAVAVGRSLASMSFQNNAIRHMKEKSSIGKAAAGLVKPGESIILDSGTTTLEVALALPSAIPNSQPVTIVTNSLPIILGLMDWSAGNLNVLGGIFLPEHQATVGPQTIANLKLVTVAKAIIGCDGLTISHGLTTAHMLVAEVGRAMVEVARQVIVVTDSSKLGQVGFTQIVPIEAIDTLITDLNAPIELVEEIRLLGIEVITV
jgi:DeoR family transcriptional regulator, aga operon transcriptional repressor